jgi:hypothetical protein
MISNNCFIAPQIQEIKQVGNKFRENELKEFLYNIPPGLMEQRIKYKLIIGR